MIQEKQKLIGVLDNKQSLSGTLSNSVIYVDPITQEKTVIPTTDQQIIIPDENYTGLSKVTVNAITLQDKTITPTTEEQIVLSDDNYNGLNKVTVNAVTNEIDDNIKPGNIKSGVDILGVTGNFIGSKYAPRYISFYKYSRTELNEELSNLDTSNITSMAFMFNTCSKLASLDLSNFNTLNVTNMSYMFQNDGGLILLDLSNFNTSNVTDMSNMFNYCRNLTSLDLSDFDTSNVTNMSYMFYSCYALASLDLSSFDTSNVTNMSYMFGDCQKLPSLDLSSFDTSNVTNMSCMFYNCLLLTDIKELDAYDVLNVSSAFFNCKQLTNFSGLKNLGHGYLTTKSANYSNYKLDLSACTALTEQSIINVLNNLYDIATKGCKTQQVVLGSTNLAKLTSEEGQTALTNATAKGWTIS